MDFLLIPAKIFNNGLLTVFFYEKTNEPIKLEKSGESVKSVKGGESAVESWAWPPESPINCSALIGAALIAADTSRHAEPRFLTKLIPRFLIP